MKDQDPTAPQPTDAAEAQAWAHQDALLRELHAEVLHEPLPDGWAALARNAGRRHTHARRWQALGGLAASLLLAFGAGWAAHPWWQQRSDTAVARHFARDAAVAHVVYSPEVRHPVEVPAAQQEHLVQWLSKRLDRPLKVPQLQARGFELVGGRLLPGDGGARAQFMFQNATGQRLTLYIGALEAGRSASETAFSFSDDRGVARFYWMEDGTGYALAGPLPRAALLDLAQDVHRQIGAR